METAAKSEKMHDRTEKLIAGELPDPPIAKLLGLRVITGALSPNPQAPA
jgi:hypothetical protein